MWHDSLPLIHLFLLLDSSAFIVVLFWGVPCEYQSWRSFLARRDLRRTTSRRHPKSPGPPKRLARTEPNPVPSSCPMRAWWFPEGWSCHWSTKISLQGKHRDSERERENRHTWQTGDSNSTPWIIFVNFSALPAKEENTTWQRWQEQLPLSCISTPHPWR